MTETAPPDGSVEWGNALLLAGLVLLLLVGPVGILWALGDGLTAYVGGKGDPADVSGEWAGKGTLLSAPLLLIVAFAVALVASRLSGRRGLAGVALTGLIALIFMVGITGELLLPDEYDGPTLLMVAFRVAFYLAGIAVVVSCAQVLRARRRFLTTNLEGGLG